MTNTTAYVSSLKDSNDFSLHDRLFAKNTISKKGDDHMTIAFFLYSNNCSNFSAAVLSELFRK